jgi:long-chain acyl-CoA synthetase
MIPAWPPAEPKPLHEYLRQHAREQPAGSAIIWYGAAISWRDLDGWSDALGAHLQTLGVTKGEPVALFMNNCPQYIVAYYAIQKIGAIVCPCGPLNKAHELQYQLDDLKARVIIAASDLLPIVDQVRAATALQHILAVHHGDLLPDEPAIAVPDELRLPPAALPAGVGDALLIARTGAARGLRPAPVAVNLDDTALMLYTSGTTGLPKGAMLSFGNVLFKTIGTAQFLSLQAHSVALSATALYHVIGMLMGVNVAVLAGAPQVLLFRFDPLAALQAISRWQVTHWCSITPMNVACMQTPDAGQYRLQSLRCNPVVSFGIKFTEALAQQWRDFTRGLCVSFELGYGLSETCAMDTGMPHHAIRWGSNGTPLPGVSICIRDPDTGAELPAGQAGEVTLHSPGNFKGYWNKPEATAQTLRAGWVWTGDVGRVDAGGYLTFMGRTKEMIKVSGYSVFPEEVETILIKHPAVAQAAVLGVPDPGKGEVVKAFIVLKAGAALDEAGLIAWSRANMAPYKAPRHIQFMDTLPTAGAGKLLRRLLRDVDQEQRA